MAEDIFKGIYNILKCFVITMFLGKYLPLLMDYILYIFITENHHYFNSIFVFTVVSKPLKIMYNYILMYDFFFSI